MTPTCRQFVCPPALQRALQERPNHQHQVQEHLFIPQLSSCWTLPTSAQPHAHARTYAWISIGDSYKVYCRSSWQLRLISSSVGFDAYTTRLQKVALCGVWKWPPVLQPSCSVLFNDKYTTVISQTPFLDLTLAADSAGMEMSPLFGIYPAFVIKCTHKYM